MRRAGRHRWWSRGSAIGSPHVVAAPRSGPANLNVWVFNEPSGSFKDAAKHCTDAVERHATRSRSTRCPTRPTRSASRSCAAWRRRTPRIDIVGMDVVWTAEFADGRLDQGVARRTLAAQVRQGTLPRPAHDRDLPGQALRRARELQHAAALVPQGPGQQAGRDVGRPDRAGRRSLKTARSRSRAPSTRASSVWFNSLVQSAGGTIVAGRQGHARARGTGGARTP